MPEKRYKDGVWLLGDWITFNQTLWSGLDFSLWCLAGGLKALRIERWHDEAMGTGGLTG